MAPLTKSIINIEAIQTATNFHGKLTNNNIDNIPGNPATNQIKRPYIAPFCQPFTPGTDGLTIAYTSINKNQETKDKARE